MYLYYDKINKKYFEKYYLNRIINIEYILNINNNNSVYNLPFNIIFNYYADSNILKLNHINELIKFYNELPNKKSICYNKLIKSKNNYNYGILPNLLNLSYIVYNNNLSKNIPILKNYFINSKAEYYIMYYIPNKNTLIISFRGTVDYNDLYIGTINTNRIKYNFITKKKEKSYFKWRENFLKENKGSNLPELNDDKVYVHSGYIKRYNYIKTHILNNIKEYKKKGLNKVILTGHSMGSSIATLCGMNIKEIYEDKIKVFISSFGGPGLGNRNLSLYFLYLNIDSYIRIYNRDDPIIKLKNNIWYKPLGRLRHVNYSVPIKYKDILESKCIQKKYKNKIIINDCQDFLPKYVKNLLESKNYKNEKKYRLLHSSFRFSNDKEAPLFT